MEEELRAIVQMLAAMSDRRARLLNAFLSGVLRGIGVMLGFAVIGTALIWLLQPIIQANLPGVSDFLAQVVTMVQMRIQ